VTTSVSAAPAASRQGAGADRRAESGEIGAVAKLAHTEHRRCPSTRERPFTLPPIDPRPSSPRAIEPQTKTDLDKMGPALQRMLEEEPVRQGRAQA